MRSRFFTTAAIGLGMGLAVWAHSATANEYLARPEVRSFIESMQTEHGLDAAELERVLGEVQYQPTVVRLKESQVSATEAGKPPE